MGTKYSSYSSNYDPGGSGKVRKFRSYITYTITQTATQVKVSLSAGVNINYSVDVNKHWKMILSGTGQTSISATGSSEYGGATTIKLASATWTYTRGSSDATKTIKATLKYDGPVSAWHGDTVTATLTVNVPKREQRTITYKNKSGTTIATQTVDAGYKATVRSTYPAVTGYTFQNWNTKADGTGTKYSPGGSITTSSNITLYAFYKTDYKAPTISKVTAYRVDNSGNPVSNGTRPYASVTITGGENMTITGVTAKVGSASPFSLTKNGDVYKKYSTSITVALSTKYKVTITVSITDTAGETHTITASTYISAETPAIDISANGNRVAFGGVATDNEEQFGLECYGNGYYKGDVYVGCNDDSSGGTKLIPFTKGTTSTDWAYIKYADGTFEAWRTYVTGSTALTHAANGAYSYANWSSISAPALNSDGTTSRPTHVKATCRNGARFASAYPSGTNVLFKVYACASVTTAQTYTVDLHIRGTWS